MIGSIFVAFLALVEEKYGFETVDKIVERLDGTLSTGGAYTTVGSYPHGEMLAMAVTLCEIEDKTMPDVVQDFAVHLMNFFNENHGSYFGASDDVFDFLMSVGDVIHADVRKLYNDARPPTVNGHLCPDGALKLDYESHRPLAQLALALTEETGKFFGQPLDIEVVERAEDDKRITMHLRKIA